MTKLQIAEQIQAILDDIDCHEGYENGTLERAMNYFCSSYDKGYGMKEAIKLTLEDQMNNHEEDVELSDLNKLSDILNGAI